MCKNSCHLKYGADPEAPIKIIGVQLHGNNVSASSFRVRGWNRGGARSFICKLGKFMPECEMLLTYSFALIEWTLFEMTKKKNSSTFRLYIVGQFLKS